MHESFNAVMDKFQKSIVVSHIIL